MDSPVDVSPVAGPTVAARPPRLLFVTTVAVTIRGFLIPIAQNFRQMGWRVDALACGAEYDAACQAAFDHVWEATWSRSPIDLRNVGMITRLRRLVVEHGYDIVHVHTPVAAFVTRLALRGLRQKLQVKVIYTAHGFHFHSKCSFMRNYMFEALERLAGPWTDKLVVINRDDWHGAVEKGFMPLERLRRMPGIGVDREYYSPSSASAEDVELFRRERGIPINVPILLMVAEFVARKCHADAIQAFAIIEHPQAHLVLAGDGPLLRSMQRLAATLGVDDRVHFLGPRHDIPTLMKAALAVVLPSRQEGLPRCVLEAMSMGVAVIGSCIRGTTELLEGGAGLLFDSGNVVQLAQAMQLVLTEPGAVAAMGQAGYEQSETYALEHILHLHEELYRDALTNPQQNNGFSHTIR